MKLLDLDGTVINMERADYWTYQEFDESKSFNKQNRKYQLLIFFHDSAKQFVLNRTQFENFSFWVKQQGVLYLSEVQNEDSVASGKV